MSEALLVPSDDAFDQSQRPSIDPAKAPMDFTPNRSSDDAIQVVVRFRPLNETEIVPVT